MKNKGLKIILLSIIVALIPTTIIYLRYKTKVIENTLEKTRIENIRKARELQENILEKQIRDRELPLLPDIDMYLSDIKENLSYWLQAWKSGNENFSFHNFEKTNEDFKRLYSDYTYENKIARKTFWNYSLEKKKALDIFLGSTIEKKDEQYYFYQDIDSGVALINTKTNDRYIIDYTGPVAGYDDSLWISDDTFIILGTIYGGIKEYKPFMVLYKLYGDFETSKLVAKFAHYNYTDSKTSFVSEKVCAVKKEYFKSKYPNANR